VDADRESERLCSLTLTLKQAQACELACKRAHE
jgi:hypothetical protein